MNFHQRCVSNNQLDVKDYTDYDPDLTDLNETFIRGVSQAKDQSIKLWGLD